MNAEAGAAAADTQLTERAAFLRRLRTDPVFLARHFGTLGAALRRRLTTRVIMRLGQVHRGRKSRPEWLDVERLEVGQGTGAAARDLTLPVYSPVRGIAGDGRAPPTVAASVAPDPEDYLAEHRWGFLTQALLAGSPDWRGGLARCVRWAQSHRDKSDPAWEPYSACERVANLLVFLATMRSAPDSPAIPDPLPAFLRDSLDWILRHLEYYGPRGTNNHILNNARAVVMAAIALGEPAAVAAGLGIFRQCLPALVSGGGFLRERSSHYQLVILNWVLDAWRFLGAGEALAGESDGRRFLSEQILRMIRAAAVVAPDGTRLLSPIGDVSPDLSPGECLARLGALYPDCGLPPSTRRARSSSRTAGSVSRRASRSVLGNFPPGRFPAEFPTHGHADFTSFAWRRGGREILVDRGRYRYTADSISTFQRCAAGHNVPLVNGFAPLCESVIAEGYWWPLPYAAAQLSALVESESLVLGARRFRRGRLRSRATRDGCDSSRTRWS